MSIFTRTQFVPVAIADTRTRLEKWTDKHYLTDLQTIGDNQVYLSEVLRELQTVRDAADGAKSPDYLHGCNVGIQALKRLLSLSARSKAAQANKFVPVKETDE